MVFIIIILNTAIFVVQSILEFYRLFPVAKYFYLSIQGIEQGYFWQLITFQFLHGGVFHLLMNLLGIYMFGRTLEDALGRAGFLRLYLLSGLAGGMLQMVVAFLFPRVFGGAVVGASGGVFGLIAAFATLYPNQPLTMLIAFVIPLEMRAKWLLAILGGLALFGLLVPTDNIAHAAHLGGLLLGIAYVRWGERAGETLYSLKRLLPRKREPVLVLHPVDPSQPQRRRPVAAPLEEPVTDDFITREVDPILDKISAYGIQSLTEQERKTLERARSRMGKR
jgi:membrane associated rhomboid family serine protease